MPRPAIHLLAAAAAIGLLLGSLAQAQEIKADGTIAKIEGNNITVKTDQAEHELVLTPGTKITLDGKPAQINDLKVGLKVRCAAEKEGEKMMCRSVEAMSS